MAEAFAVRVSQESGRGLYYLATMRASGAEGAARVAKHRRQRAGKGFLTVECPSRLPCGIAGGTVLLECLSNRLANAMFGDGERDPVVRILAEIDALAASNDLIVVTNEVFSDGGAYDAATCAYIENLGKLNRALAERAALVIESVYSLPIVHKGVWR